MPNTIHRAWFVGYAERGSCIREVFWDPAVADEIAREMSECMYEYVHDFLPNNGIEVPQWLLANFPCQHHE